MGRSRSQNGIKGDAKINSIFDAIRNQFSNRIKIHFHLLKITSVATFYNPFSLICDPIRCHKLVKYSTKCFEKKISYWRSFSFHQGQSNYILKLKCAMNYCVEDDIEKKTCKGHHRTKRPEDTPYRAKEERYNDTKCPPMYQLLD